MGSKRFYLFIVIGLGIILSACQQTHEITSTTITLDLGDTDIDLVLHESSAEGLTYLNLHDNENTSVRAALDIIKQHGGRLYELKHSGKRNISFTLEGTEYEFDPNRIFSDAGAAASLERFGPTSDKAVTTVRSFAESLLTQIGINQIKILVTLHNNGPGGYSILGYKPNGDYSIDALHVNINDMLDPDDFYYVTESSIYEDLLKTDQNVVLQDNEHVTEDGSLSVWSAQNQLPYINVEGQSWHRRIQMNMILLLHELYFIDHNEFSK